MQKELDLRLATNYENEVSTLFDYVMLYMKIWKMGCQRKLAGHKQWHMSTYKFICEIESCAYDFTKAILADAESLKFKPSIIVACVISATIEIYLNLKLQQKSPEGLPSIGHLKLLMQLGTRSSKSYLDNTASSILTSLADTL